MSELEAAMALAGDPAAACAVVADHLDKLDVLPSVYLQQGERLRCLASRGYYALYDGMSSEAGLVGRCYRTGDVVDEADVATSEGFLRSVTTVKTARCVPIKVGPRVVGVLCVESPSPIAADAARHADRCAELLGRRLAELGRLDAATPGQHLARAAARTAGMEDADAVMREVAAAAMQVSGFESVDASRCATPSATSTPSTPPARSPTPSPPSAAASSPRWRAGSSPARRCSPWPTPPARGTRSPSRCASPAPARCSSSRSPSAARASASSPSRTARRSAPDTERTELIELLGVQAAAQLRGLAAVAELRDRAARDPLTGLGHEQAFQAKLAKRRKAAVAAGQKTAVVLAELDSASDEVLRGMAALLAELGKTAQPPASAYRLRGDEFALLVDTSDRGAAQEVAWQLQAKAREQLGVTLSIGVAVADQSESDAELLERADAAVSEVRRRGRDGVALATQPVQGGR